MAIINARKPYKITHFGQTLEIDLYIYAHDATPPTVGVDTPNYQLKKVSFENGTDETLALDISPYIRDYFEHSPNYSINNSGDDIGSNEYLNVDAVVNTVEENHTALNGWLDAKGSGQGPVEYTRNINDNTKGGFSVKNSSYSTVKYTRDDGSYVQYGITATADYIELPYVPSTYTIGDSKTLTIKLDGPKDKEFTCNVRCDFDPDNHVEIYFVNGYGLWESVPMVGNMQRSIKVDQEDYTNAETEYDFVYDTDGRISYVVNTGWLREDSAEMVKQLMMSNNIFIDHNTFASRVKLKSMSKQLKTQLTDKMINYTFNFEVGSNIINYES